MIVLGGRTRKEIEPLLSDFQFFDIGIMTVTDDGSLGMHGMVTDVLKTLSLPDNCIVYTCGPEPMMKSVAAICREQKVDCQVSVESVMACGMGACLGCTIKAKDDRYVHVCSDGPVFKTEDLGWNL